MRQRFGPSHNSNDRRQVPRWLLLLGLLLGCHSEHNAIEFLLGPVPMVGVVANQQYYDGKYLATAGFLILDDRSRPVLYLDETKAVRGFPADSFCVQIHSNHLPQLLLMTNHSVVVLGRYAAKERGDGGLHSGSITEIERIFPLAKFGSETNSVGLRGLWDISSKPKRLVAPH